MSVSANNYNDDRGTCSGRHTVHWFRKGLRFLLQCLEDLDRSLRQLNSRLFVVRGQPADTLPKLFKEWNTTCLSFEEDPEPYGKVRDHNIAALCQEMGIDVVQRVSHTLYKLERIIEKNGGIAPLTYHQFQAVIANMENPPFPEPTLTSDQLGAATTPLTEDHEEKYGVPSLDELGFDTDGLLPPVWKGGESEALARLERHLERKAWVASFGRPKMTPQSLLASQTGLSPYLRFGCLSTRLFYYQLTDLYQKIKKARPPLSLHGQLLWREFFYCAATKNANFDKMLGNPICVQIPWDKNAEALAKWANGQTGFPWIDAIITQLQEEGWIHLLARHAVACFLTRGDLWISWEEGMKVFEELLLDADWSVNAGMWMWLSCSSFFQQFFHCYCPVRFGRKADPNGDYIRKYLPALKNFPTRYIHEPWIAPESVQKAAKCIVGHEYPLPMVNHASASRVNIERMKQVQQHLVKFRGPGLKAALQNINNRNKSPDAQKSTTNENKLQCFLCPISITTDNDLKMVMKSKYNYSEFEQCDVKSNKFFAMEGGPIQAEHNDGTETEMPIVDSNMADLRNEIKGCQSSINHSSTMFSITTNDNKCEFDSKIMKNGKHAGEKTLEQALSEKFEQKYQSNKHKHQYEEEKYDQEDL